ncbi:hypothetical protein [Herbiconiux liukaitaii]|uniref:hypothetical protein n=1 Tax=Herbiconiux liukaitaii TaxID=3342799 RepID=UPI0035BA43FD
MVVGFGMLSGGVPAAWGAPPPVVTGAPGPGSVLIGVGGAFGEVLTGVGPPGGSILVTTPVEGDAHPLCFVDVAADGSWACPLGAAPSSSGPLTVSNGTDFAAGDITVLEVALLHPPTVESDAGSVDTITPTMTVEDPTQEIRGAGVPFNLVAVTLNDGSGCTGHVGADGLWSCLLTALPSGAGPYSLVAAQAFPSAPSTWATTAPYLFALEAPTIIVPDPDPDPVPDPDPDPDPAPDPDPVPGPDPVPDPGPGIDPEPSPGTVPESDPGDVTGPEGGVVGGVVGEAEADGSDPTEADHGKQSVDVLHEEVGESTRDGGLVGSLSSGSASGAGDRTGEGSRQWSAEGKRENSGGSPGSRESPGAGDDEVVAAGAGDGGSVGEGGVGVGPSAFALSLVTPDGAFGRAGTGIVFLGVLIGAAMLLVMVPGGILEATIHENADRIRRSAPARLLARIHMAARTLIPARLEARGAGGAGRAGGATVRPGSRGFASAWGIAVVLGVGAVGSAMVSPEAGVTATTGGLVVAFLGAALVMGVVGVGVAVLVGRRFELRGMPFGRPAALVLTAASVVVSRVAGLDPGFVFGALIGVQFVALTRVGRRVGGGLDAAGLAPAGRASVDPVGSAGVAPVGRVGTAGRGGGLGAVGAARVAVVGAGASVVLGVGAWVVQGAVRPGVVERPDVLGVLLLDLATAVTVGALSGPVVSLLPLRFLDGGTMLAHSRRLWAAAWAGAALVFGFVLLPVPAAWSELGNDLVPWLAWFGAFALLTAAVWAYFRFVPARASGSAAPAPSALDLEQAR